MGKLVISRVLLAGLLAALAHPALAQTGTVVPGGLELSFGFSERLEADDNLPLAVTSPGNSTVSTTRLSFALKSETKTERLSFTASTAVRAAYGSGVTNKGTNLDDPRFDLAYSRDVGNSVLSVGANYRRSDVQFLRPLSDFLDANGQIILPTDASDLTGTGNRTDYGVNGSLAWGVTAPFGVTVSAGASGLTYSQVSNPALTDTQRRNIAANFRLRLNDVTDGNVRLGFDQFENVATANTTNSRTLAIGLTRQLVDGSLNATFTARNSAGGTRLGFDVRRDVQLPTGSLGYGVGLTKPDGGSIGVTGALDWQYQLPQANISARLNRSVTFNTANVEQLQTTLALGYNQALSPRTGMAVNLSYSVADPAGLANDTTNANFGASYFIAVTSDWNMSLGYNYNMRNNDTVGRANSNSVFLGLSRNFNIRP